ncbi:hypothetical protein [Paenibacillus sp. GYB003]|uniref:hypothetical protein n=1 Tax=Paenibacillus sp. GYB003 TaxID=2994392 RepID=UPI002F9632D7
MLSFARRLSNALSVRGRAPRAGAKRGGGRFCKAAALLALLPLLTGCLYPKEMRKENQATVKESVLIVQNAIDQYKEKNGVLPIKNSETNTPIYEKYTIDLKKLTSGPYLGQVPAIAFENGGSYLFVLVHPEQKPEVKLLDLVAYQKTGDIQKSVDAYRKANGGRLPLGEPAGTGIYRLDFAKLGQKAEQVQSAFSRQYLGFLIDRDGIVGIDYASDIMQAMERKGMKSAESGVDLRELLVADAPFVPVKSFPYYWIDGEPKAAACP